MADDPHDFQYSHVVYTRTGSGANGVTEIVTICRHCGASRKGVPDQAPTVDQLAAVYAKGLADALKEIEARFAAEYRGRLIRPAGESSPETDRVAHSVLPHRTVGARDSVTALCEAFDEGRQAGRADRDFGFDDRVRIFNILENYLTEAKAELATDEICRGLRPAAI